MPDHVTLPLRINPWVERAGSLGPNWCWYVHVFGAPAESGPTENWDWPTAAG